MMASPRKHVQAMWKHLESGASKPRISETAASLGPVIRAFRHHSMFGLSPLGLIACIISVLFLLHARSGRRRFRQVDCIILAAYEPSVIVLLTFCTKDLPPQLSILCCNTFLNGHNSRLPQPSRLSQQSWPALPPWSSLPPLSSLASLQSSLSRSLAL